MLVSKHAGRKLLRLLTHRLGFFKIGVITAILRQAGSTDDPKDSLTTRSMCGIGHNPALPTPSAGESVPGPACTTCLQSPGPACAYQQMSQWRSCQEWVPVAGSGSSSRGGSYCCMSSRAVRIVVTLQWNGQLLFAVMKWQRPGGCAGQERSLMTLYASR